MKKLERSIGLVSVIAISLSAMLGSGIFVLPGLAYTKTGSSIWLAYLIAGLCVVPAALCKAELGTAMQYGLPLTLVVFNDSAWGILKRNQKRFRDGQFFATSLVNPDFVQLAAAYGIDGRRVDCITDLHEELHSATRSDKMRLIEVSVPDGYGNFQ